MGPSLKLVRNLVAASFAIGALCVVSPAAPLQAAINNDVPFQTQDELDSETLGDCSSWCAGGWAAMDGGVDARPFIKDLSVVNISGEMNIDWNVLDNPSNSATPTHVDGTNVDATVGAVNLCPAGQEPTPGQCYATPNRVQINFGWRDGGQGTGDLGASGSIPSIDADSEIRVTIGLNTLGQSLRWSYLEGTPTYWKVNNIGQEDATIDLHFRPSMKPMAREGCSQIPVNPTCPTTSAENEYLMGSLLLSLDDTLDSVFTGALFAGEGLFIGSLQAVAAQATESGSSAPQMTYGISAPLTVGGAENRPTFQAFLSDQAILNYFGATPDVAATNGFFSSAFNFDSGNTTQSQTIAYSRWEGADEGTNGWLVTVSNIQLDSQLVQAESRLHSQARIRVAKNPHFVVKTKKRPGTISATRTQISIRNVDGCAVPGQCRIVVSKIASLVGSRTVSIGTATFSAPFGVSMASLNFASVPRNSRLSIVVQKKKPNGRWGTYVTSAVRKVR